MSTSMPNKRVNNWILCVLRNGRALTAIAHCSFLGQDVPNVRLLYIDNASSDGTTAWLNSVAGPGVSVIWNRTPQSVARCWNQGLRLLFDSGEDHVLVVNNDIELPSWYYGRMLEHGGEFVSGVSVDRKPRTWPPPDPSSESPHPCYSAYLIRKSCWTRVPFDENCEIAFVEDSLHHTACHYAGIRCVSINVPFYHAGSQTIKLADREERERIQQAADRNREYFRSLYGCLPGTAEYEALFSEETFGCKRPTATSSAG